MARHVWIFVGLYLAGIGCVVVGVLRSPKHVPGAPRVEVGPVGLGLFSAAAALVLVGGRFGLYPLLHHLMAKREVPDWLFILIILVLVGGAILAYLFLSPDH